MNAHALQHAHAHAIIGRWDAAIGDIFARADQLLADAWAGSQPLIAAVDRDLLALSQVWGAVQARLHGFSEEVSQRWDEVSDALGEVDDLAEETMAREGNKRDWACSELEIRYTRTYRHAMACGAEVLRQRALHADASARQCTQCGGTLASATPVSQALNVACSFCGAINTVAPHDALRMFAAAGAMFLGEVAALPSWEAMQRAHAQMQSYRLDRDVPLALLSQYEAYAREYWTTRLTVEGQFVPEEQHYTVSRLERSMKDTDKTLRRYGQWRQRAT